MTVGMEKALFKLTSDSLFFFHNKDQPYKTELMKGDLFPETNYGFYQKLFQCCLV